MSELLAQETYDESATYLQIETVYDSTPPYSTPTHDEEFDERKLNNSGIVHKL